MDPFDECSVLLPSATLDDFPSGGSDEDARSLLAGWTVLWHPQLLARTEQLPTWYRTDAAPTPDGPRVIVVPDPCITKVPAEYRRKCEANSSCIWVTGADRDEMLRVLSIDNSQPELQPMELESRVIGVEDFYAAGYLSLQIQVMTRRLRYTSNLDELYLQSRIVAAAKSFCERDAGATVEALHEVFDALSEERDHYFSSDPHLVDLTLLTPSVLKNSIKAGWLESLDSSARPNDEANGVIGTPRNVLLDGDVAADVVDQARAQGEDSIYKPFVELLAKETIGWAGGGPASSDDAPIPCVDAMTMADAIDAFRQGSDLAKQATSEAPLVYARLSGSTPVDLVPSLAALGYRGVIPMDFSAGTGFGEESKLLIQSGNIEIEALTAKPIDAASDAAYLSIGAVLGEAIDGGEVATGLLVHWPEKVCDSHRDLVRAASWSLALGRFWSIDDYFTKGERPYHSGQLSAISAEAAEGISSQITCSDSPNQTMANLADQFTHTVRHEADQVTHAVAQLVKPTLVDEESVNDAASAIAIAVGESEQSSDVTSTDVLCFNPHGGAIRCQVELEGAPDESEYVYAVSKSSRPSSNNLCSASIDIPSLGFTRLHGGKAIKGGNLLKRLVRKSKGIAEHAVLRNEFMAVSISEENGGISGIYSASRGNRLSMRLNMGEGLCGDREGGQMRCREMAVTHSDPSKGTIVCKGDLCDHDGRSIADFQLQYTLQRGSRFIDIQGSILTKDVPAELKGLFTRAFSVRTAVAAEASIIKALVRDKIHTTNARRIVSPLGVVIDEAEKQTLVCGHGLPLHRKVGDRFLDTVVAIAHQSNETVPFQLSYGIDCPQPIAAARGLIAPPLTKPLPANEKGKTNQAWLVHTGSPDVQITKMQTSRRTDGRLACRLTLVQTRPKNTKVKLQFATFAHAAFHADGSGIERSLEALPETVRCDDGAVSLNLTSHEAADLIVVFDV
ncbi:hypothetical protein LOC67_12715 [Stieleria sp. JC731]|uniref:hypothetical protein n=1 Tax=Pirellulaceae TaxID=2691357 RepID=UPI001E518D05|nr:hypothetical protein [Stieleria sp. JC731]MCC9601410.1 hypothetical protein [Stieleria sp. JC731]